MFRSGSLMLGIVAFVALSLPGLTAMSHAGKWDFKDPKNVNAIGIFLDSKLEPIRGYADGISGIIHYNRNDPKTFRGEITVDVGSIQMSNLKMTEHLHGEKWLNLEQFRTITFKFNEVVGVDWDEHGVAVKVKGVIEAFGLKVPKTVEIEIDIIPDGAEARSGSKGDLMLLRSKFNVTRADLGIRPNMDDSKVANVIEIDVAIAGYHME